MRWTTVAALLFASGPVLAQGTEPKPKATDYPAHAETGSLSLGAEYMVHSFTGRKQTFVTRDYLVVEVALYGPPPGERIEVSQGHFALRINGRKETISPQAPSFVSASLKYPDWEMHPTLEAGAGVGDAGVIVGRPQQTARFPGDQRPPDARAPKPPRVPEQDHGVEKEPAPRAEDVVIESALAEGNVKAPASGYLYFSYKGKVTAIRSLELIYTGPEGPATLAIFRSK